MALKACPHPPDMSSMETWVAPIVDLSFSLSESGVTPEVAAVSAAAVSVCAAMAGEEWGVGVVLEKGRARLLRE